MIVVRGLVTVIMAPIAPNIGCDTGMQCCNRTRMSYHVVTPTGPRISYHCTQRCNRTPEKLSLPTNPDRSRPF